MPVRTFSTLRWNALGPADYELVGYPDIKAHFDGSCWKIHGRRGYVEEVTFPSMEILSKVVKIVCENMRGNPNLRD